MGQVLFRIVMLVAVVSVGIIVYALILAGLMVRDIIRKE